MSRPEADWHLGRGECLEWSGVSSAEEAFTKIYIRFTDVVTGEQGVAEAEVQVDDFPLLETVVPRHPPGPRMTRAEAQDLADEAAAVLGGVPIRRYWARIRASTPLPHRDGTCRRAELMKPRDAVTTDFHPGEVLFVFGITREDETMLVSLADVDLDRRLDVEMKLFALEQG